MDVFAAEFKRHDYLCTELNDNFVEVVKGDIRITASVLYWNTRTQAVIKVALRRGNYETFRETVVINDPTDWIKFDYVSTFLATRV